MDFIQHTINWCSGEIFEGKLLALWGLAILIVTFFFWKTGTTPFAKAIVIPLLVVGLLTVASGASLVINNNKRIVTFQKEYQADKTAFIKSEKKRTDYFIKWYPWTMIIMGVIMLGGVVLMNVKGTPLPRAIALAMMLFSFSILFLDHFSEERADVYHREIVKALQTIK